VVAKKELIEVICANGQDRTKIEKRIDKMVAEGLIYGTQIRTFETVIITF